MSYLLDTNVISELKRPRPDARVLRWFSEVPRAALHLSVLSIGEIRDGVERLGNERRRENLRVCLEQDLPAWFEDRLVPVTSSVADRWGRLLAAVKRPVPAVDSLLAATALVHGLRIVTRNSEHFRYPDLDIVNPWSR